jgi:[NiFe] hydrogenase assembly HybE family chaperone
MSDGVALRSDPSLALERTFERVHAERMQGLQFVNCALRVEAVAFEPWRHYWLGVMLTPWSMNLMLTPRDAAAWRPLPVGEKRRYGFPAGAFDFIAARDEGFGDYLVCSLFSPVQEFTDHETARETARLARQALFDPAHAEPAEAGDASARSAGTNAAEAPRPLAELTQNLAAPLTRRELLRGHCLLGGSDASRR